MNLPAISGASEKSPAGSQPHVTFLDHLRGLAIFLVYLQHSGMRAFGSGGLGMRSPSDLHSSLFDLAMILPSMGHVGVAIFFVVSGFCIHLSHVKSRERGYKNFFGRRFFRLYPAYAIALVLSAFVIPPFLPLLASPAPALNFASHLLLLHNLFPQFAYTVDGPCWTIGVEVQLYLLYPLLLAIVNRLGWRNALILVFAVEAVSVNSPSIFFHFHAMGLISYMTLTPFYYWFSWSIGAKVADDWMGGRPIFLARFPLWIWPLFFAVTFTGVSALLGRFNFTFAALATATLTAFLLSHGSVVASLPRIPFAEHFRKVGLVSYSAYLFHEPCLGQFLQAFRRLFPILSTSHFATFLFCLLTWPLVVGVAWISYRLIELPGIALGKRLLRRNRPGNGNATLRPTES